VRGLLSGAVKGEEKGIIAKTVDTISQSITGVKSLFFGSLT